MNDEEREFLGGKMRDFLMSFGALADATDTARAAQLLNWSRELAPDLRWSIGKPAAKRVLAAVRGQDEERHVWVGVTCELVPRGVRHIVPRDIEHVFRVVFIFGNTAVAAQDIGYTVEEAWRAAMTRATQAVQAWATLSRLSLGGGE